MQAAIAARPALAFQSVTALADDAAGAPTATTSHSPRILDASHVAEVAEVDTVASWMSNLGRHAVVEPY
jgi:hypothetical protein